MKTIRTTSEILGFTTDTYQQFNWGELMVDGEDITDETEIDGDQYTADVARLCAEVLDSELSGDVIRSVKNTGYYSPKFYDFYTDSSYLDVAVDLELLLQLMNTEGFAAYLKRNYTSYDGFWSNVTTDIGEFSAKLALDDDSEDWHLYAGALLAYYCEEHLDEDRYLDLMHDQIMEVAMNCIKL